MIYITGDTHSYLEERLNVEAFPEQKEMTKEDFVIITGDFGGVWYTKNEAKNAANYSYDEAEKVLDWLDSLPFTTCFVCGNHENFDRLYNEYEVVDFHGGKAHKIRDSIYHLMRGEIFELDGKKIFAFGGAKSHDIKDGILEPDQMDLVPLWQYRRKAFRVNHLSWWKEEMPSEAEMQNGRMNLANEDNTVDFVITHDCPIGIFYLLGYAAYPGREVNPLQSYLQEIAEKTKFKKWFFGHHHVNMNVTDQFIALFDQIIRIA